MESAVFNGNEARRRLYLRGMRGDQLAEAVGVSSASISYYLTGQRRPSAPVFLRICEVLGVQPDELCTAPRSAPSSASSRDAA